MSDGIHLTLLIGPAVPVPAPAAVLDALDSVQVTSGGDRSGFQLTFQIGKTSLLQTTLLPAGYFDPIVTRVIVIATVRGMPNVLIDGVVTRQEIVAQQRSRQVDAHHHRRRPEPADGSGRDAVHALPGAAGHRARLRDPGQVRGVRHRADRDPADHARHPQSARGNAAARTAPTATTSSSSPAAAATCSTSSPARRRDRTSPTSGPTSASRRRSRRSTSTWMRTPMSSR